MPAVDLEYDPRSFAGPLDMEEVHGHEKSWLRAGHPFNLDKSYLRHISRYHGGEPGKKCFRTPKGRERVVERFLNFVEDYDDSPLGDYHIEVMRCLIEDRLNDFLLPFAVLFAGDMLCFDYSKGKRPSVVVWLHEESGIQAPVTEPVAAGFDEFLSLLYRHEAVKPIKKGS